jgi:thioredoxin-dependent peroxiredoxin
MVTLKGQTIQVVGAMPKIGVQAPALMGVDPEWKEHSLSDFKGKKKIICFVPSLDTSVCSMSAQRFNERVKHAALIYCSMDLPFAMKRICEHLSHVTPLSLFRTPQVADSYGTRQGDGPLKGLCARAVFVLDEHDKIIYHELVQEITNEPDYDAAIRILESTP